MKAFFKNPWWPLLVVLAYLGTAAIFAQAPAWWSNRGVLLSGPGVVTNDFSLVNQGQVKWLATQAAAEFNEKLEALGGAGTGITALVASFSTNYNFRPVNAGQLKNTVKPFYDRLLELDLTNCYPQGAAVPYPWSGSTNPARDFSVVNAGQTKYVFSFDTAGVNITTNTDTDADGLPDWWEMLAAGSRTGANPNDDPNGDGLTNAERQQLGLGPTQHVNVVTLAQSDLTFEVKAVETSRSKDIGFQDFVSQTNENLPPTYYLQQSRCSRYFYNEGDSHWYFDYSQQVEVPQGLLVGSWNYDSLFIADGGTNYSSWTNYSSGSAAWVSNGICSGQVTASEPSEECWTNEVHGPQHVAAPCHILGWSFESGPIVETTRTTEILIWEFDPELYPVEFGEDKWTNSQVFTTAILNQIVSNDFVRGDPFTNLAWGYEWVYDKYGVRTENMTCDPTSFRHLSTNELQLDERKLLYRAVADATQSALQTGTVYRVNLAHVFTPDGVTTNLLQFSTNFFAHYLGGSQIVFNASGTMLNIPASNGEVNVSVLKVDFKELWETSNRVNQVFNPTPKDDPPPTASNKIYIVESPDSLYHVTLDVDDQPASMRSKLMYAVFVDGSKISGSDGFYPVTGPADITFDHPGASAALEKDFELRVGYDLNGNSTLDSTEEIPISVTNTAGTVIGPPITRGTSSPRYPVAMGVVDTAVADTLTLPHASRLLRIFRDATTTGLPTDKAPTATSTISFNCYSDPWAVWLTHNAGAPFNASGTTSIQYYVWGTNTSLAGLVCKSHQMVTAAETFYNSNVLTAANAFFATNPVGTIATFPLNGASYDIPHTDESPSWVTNYLAGVTVTFDEPTQWNIGFDDVFGAIGRGRVLSHTATYTIEKVDGLFGPKLVLNSIHYTGVVEDLYDFNRDGGGAGEEAAIIQLGHGNGSYGSGRTSGVIYKDRIEINQTVNDPF